ncbi:hypothetical protein [Legionella pneumophila]|uniref:hypothetical protein n=1 Tax=Legionella pneumophila TaxID=446 RepID=UPI000777B321|nr:hypothetical protein [Legionella pneumophila]MDW8872820.1 hypothetical protein [Legionella pneumophila]HAT8656781.1 hypothetical protein [Legionella pneumophila]
MNQSIDLTELKRIKDNLRQQPQTLDELWFSYPGLWQALAWNKVQLSLWLTCQPDIVKEENEASISTYISRQQDSLGRIDLGEEIVRILKVEQRPLALNFIKNKLPTGTFATETILKKAIEDHPQLTMMGPLVKLNLN